MLGGAVAKLDKILGRYKDNELEYWIDWADVRSRYNEADAASDEVRADNVQQMKYKEQMERLKKLMDQTEKKKADVADALLRQANGIIKDSTRLKDYWDMKKAKVDEDAAKESYEEVKKSTTDETIHDLFDKEIQRVVEIAREKDKKFREQYGPISSGRFFDQAPDENEDLTVSGIRISDLISKPISELQSKLKSIDADKLGEILKYLEKKLKDIKDQRDEDIKSVKDRTQDKNQIGREIDELSKKVKPVIDVIKTKVDYIYQLMLANKGGGDLKHQIKSNPEIVTDKTTAELGNTKIDNTIKAAVAEAPAKGHVPTIKETEADITKYADKFFTDMRFVVEDKTGKIEDSQFAHLKNDLNGLFGKLTFYYKQKNQDTDFKVLQMSVNNFASEVYDYKKEQNKLDADLDDAELNTMFDKINK
jgi:hypothetical protein